MDHVTDPVSFESHLRTVVKEKTTRTYLLKSEVKVLLTELSVIPSVEETQVICMEFPVALLQLFTKGLDRS